MDIDDPELVIVGTAGQKITRIGADLPKRCHPHLKSLVLRSHLIQTMDPCLQQFRELETLELYDNMIEDLQYLGPTNHSSLAAIENNDTSANEEVAASSATATSPTDQVITLGPPGNTLKILDMSYNAIRDMAPVAYCPHLVELYLANNKLKAMAGLRELSNLRKLDLGANKLREMDPNELAGLLSLEELWLGKNKIETIQGLDHLTKLRRLDVQSNRLTCVDQLQHLVETLEELYLAHNGLTDEGVTNFTKWDFAQLSTLDLSRNQLTTTVSLSHLTTLEELWLSGNQITNFENGVLQPLASLVNLETVYLEYNPIAQEFEYRINLKERIPSLQQIDATPILTVHHVTTSTGATQPRGVLLPPTSRELQEQVIHRARAEMEQQQQSTNTTKADKS
jgi:protein phosphatase 1 regulatory subunit 7